MVPVLKHKKMSWAAPITSKKKLQILITNNTSSIFELYYQQISNCASNLKQALTYLKSRSEVLINTSQTKNPA